MATYELLARHLGGAREVVDISGGDLAEEVGLPDGVRLRRVGDAEAAGFEPAPGVAVLASDGSPALPAVLPRLRPGARVVVIHRWPAVAAADAPVDPDAGLVTLSDRLAAANCEVRDVDALAGGGQAALVTAECVEKVTAPPDDDPPALLRVVNRAAVAEGSTARIADLTARIAAADRQLRKARGRQRHAETKLARLEASAGLAVVRAVVRGARRPLHGVVSVPRDLTRIVRQHRRGEQPDRIVDLPLPGVRRRLTLRAPRDLIVPHQLDDGGLRGYEPDSMACFLAAADVAGPGAVYDIGANIGIFAALASALTGRDVRAFEPTPALAAVARRFARDNRLRWRTEEVALGARNGTAAFYLSDVSDSSNSLAPRHRPSSAHIDVPVETLDSYVARTGAAPAVLKIDTESTEPDVLAGAGATLTRHRPWILCEVLAGRVEDRLMEVLAPYGYRYYQVSGPGPYPAAEVITGDPRYKELNWLFAPQEPDERFWAAVRERYTQLRAGRGRR